jgi:HlyD family secretion protein
MTRTQTLFRTATLVTLVAAAGGGGLAFVNRHDAAPSVTTATITRGDIVDVISATGTIEAVTRVEVGSQVSGSVKELNADFNTFVRKGQVLARLDPALFATQVEQARASVIRAQAEVDRLNVSLADAQAKLARTESLAARLLVSASDLEDAQVSVRSAAAQVKSAEASLTQARASLGQAQVNLDHTVITSPIDGIVISRNVDAGQTVAASMQAPTLFVLAADLARMRVSASLDESDVGRVVEGQPVTFRVDAYPSDQFTGTVAQVRLQPVVTQNVVTYTTIIDCQNAELRLKPGMTASVTIEVARSTNVLQVQNAALRFKPTAAIIEALAGPSGAPRSTPPAATVRANAGTPRATVWQYTNGALAPVQLTLGITNGTVTEVTGGTLALGDTVVTSVSAAVSASSQAATKTTSTTRSPLMQGPSGPPPR